MFSLSLSHVFVIIINLLREQQTQQAAVSYLIINSRKADCGWKYDGNIRRKNLAINHVYDERKSGAHKKKLCCCVVRTRETPE